MENKKKLFKNYNSDKNKSVNFIPLKSDIMNKLDSNPNEKRMYTDILTLSEYQSINSEIYDKFLNLDSKESKMQKNSKRSPSFLKYSDTDGYHDKNMNNYENNLSKEIDKNKEVKKEEEISKEEINDDQLEEYYNEQLENERYVDMYEEDEHETSYEVNDDNKYKISEEQQIDEYEYEKEDIKEDKEKSEIKKKKSINYNYSKNVISKNNTALNKSSMFKNLDEENIIKDIILDIYKNTMEHKKTNFLCLEEILKKINLILKMQTEMNNSNISQKSERQLLFQNIYELKKQVADKAFNSLANKDFTKFYIKKIHEEYMGNKINKNVKKNSSNLKKLEKINEKSNKYFEDFYENFKTKNKNVNLFLSHLNELEKSVYTFTHFCRSVSSQTYPDGRIGLNSLEQKV